jgi:thiamine-phosphate pyrophosphorylase
MKTWWQQSQGYYAILDPEHIQGRDPLVVADALIAAPCAALQLRCKNISDKHFIALALALREKTQLANVPLVINDRADIARLVNADGLHLGQNDLPIAEARKFFGQGCLGLSTHNLAQARQAVELGVDLIGLGPIFATRSKRNPDQQVGLQTLQRVCDSVQLPVIAIGGIGLNNVGDVVRSGARFAAAISSITEEQDIASAARVFASKARDL